MEESKGKEETQEKRGFELIEKLILDGEAPTHIKIAAAKGALPLNPLSLLRLKVFLKDDADSSVHSEALRGIESLPDEELLEMLKERKCHALVLAFFADKKKDDKRFLDTIVQNPACPDESLALIAASASAETLHVMITNEQRLIASSALLDALEKNTSLNELQRAKIRELKDKFLTGRAPIEGSSTAQDAEQEEGLSADLDVDALIGDSYIIGGDEFEKGPQDVKNIYQAILMMTMPEKILKALRGGMRERQILIRDSRKIISLTVLNNPRISEQEIENISSSKNVDDEVLREIGRNRNWTRHYTVSANLVKNPKTPPSISTSLMHRLTNTDLKQMQTDKNLPELIRAMAKKVLDTRTQKAAGLKKK